MVGAPAFRGQEVKEALRAQMEVQRLLEQVEVTKSSFSLISSTFFIA